MYLKGNVVYSVVLMDLGRNCQPFYLQDHFLGFSRLLVYLKLNRTSYHHVG